MTDSPILTTETLLAHASWVQRLARRLVRDLTFLSRLAALIPYPRQHLLTYHGILAPAASARDRIVPPADEPQQAQSCRRSADGVQADSSNSNSRSLGQGTRRRYIPWAELLRRVLERHTNCSWRRRSVRSLLHHAHLKPGQPAPDFSLQAHTGDGVREYVTIGAERSLGSTDNEPACPGVGLPHGELEWIARHVVANVDQVTAGATLGVGDLVAIPEAADRRDVVNGDRRGADERQRLRTDRHRVLEETEEVGHDEKPQALGTLAPAARSHKGRGRGG